MCKLVNFNFLMFIIFYNHHVSGIENCYHKVFVQNTAEDNMLLQSGLLLEVDVSHRAECISLSHLQDECNLILYNPSSSRCRLHNFDHANQTGTGIMTPGWSNYARKCSEQPAEPDCNVTDLAKLDSCQSCFQDNAWKHNDMCITFKRVVQSIGGNYESLDFDSDFGPGTIVVVNGSVYDTYDYAYVNLEDTADYYEVTIRIDMIFNMCETYNGIDYNYCHDVMPQIDPSAVTFTFKLTNSGIQIYIDGKLIIQYNLQLKVIRMDIFGFGYGTEVTIVNAAESCI